ncbi:hypothetical protein D9M71_825500 [compost metagenome]
MNTHAVLDFTNRFKTTMQALQARLLLHLLGLPCCFGTAPREQARLGRKSLLQACLLLLNQVFQAIFDPLYLVVLCLDIAR